jgi:CarD family transcriptional regulator
MAFYPAQLVVYPTHGVGIVDRIESKDIGGVEVDFYIVRILGSNIILMVPVDNAAHVGLRNLSTPEYCKEILEGLRDRSGFNGYTGQNWNRRYREYSEKLKTGALIDSCNVLKELLLISGEKDLSFGERRLLEQAMNLVTLEIACVTENRQEFVQNEIEAMFEDILTSREKNV